MRVGGRDGETVLTKESPPRAGGDAGEVVVTETPAVRERGHAVGGQYLPVRSAWRGVLTCCRGEGVSYARRERRSC